MTKKEPSGGDNGLSILIVIIFSFAGEVFATFFPSNYYGLYYGLLLGGLIGLGLVLTVQYASIKIRRN